MTGKYVGETFSMPEFLRSLDVIITPVVLSDSDDHHFYHNSAFEEAIGYRMDDVYDAESWCLMAFPEEQYRNEIMMLRHEKVMEAAHHNYPYYHYGAKVCCKDGKYRWFDIYGHTIGNIRISTFLDVDEYQSKSLKLMDIVRFKRTVLSSLAHDIKGPLSAMQGIIRYSESMKLSRESLLKTMSKMNEQITGMFNLIDATVIHEGDEMNKQFFIRQKLYLAPLLENVLQYFEADTKEKGLTINFNFSGEDHVFYDTFILEIMLRNILFNAIKYLLKNGTVTISFDQDELFSRIIIQDDGPGIEDEKILKLLRNEPLHYAKEEIDKGFGLGLIMAKDSLERHQGRLDVTSVKGQGSCFTIFIPKK